MPRFPKGEEPDQVLRAVFHHASAGRGAVLGRLLDLGMSPDLENDEGDSMLLLASRNGHLGVVELLLMRGADPDRKSANGQTPLAAGIASDNHALVEKLLDLGAEIDQPTGGCMSAIEYAATVGTPDMLDLLIRRATRRAAGQGMVARVAPRTRRPRTRSVQ